MGRKAKKGNTENYRRGGKWYIRFTYRGRLYRESAKSSDKDIAKTLLEQRQREIAEGRFGPRADRTTFDDLEKLIVRDYETNGRKSLGSLTDRIDVLRKTFGKVRPVDVTYKMLDEYKGKRLTEGAKPATIRYELVVFGRMFTLAIHARMLTVKPLLPTLTVENARKGFFSEDEFRRVLRHLTPDIGGPMMFAYFTGWRVGEIRKLTWANVNFKEGLVRLEADQTKNLTARIFPFNAHEYLKGLMEAQRERVDSLQREHGRMTRPISTSDISSRGCSLAMMAVSSGSSTSSGLWLAGRPACPVECPTICAEPRSGTSSGPACPSGLR